MSVLLPPKVPTPLFGVCKIFVKMSILCDPGPFSCLTNEFTGYNEVLYDLYSVHFVSTPSEAAIMRSLWSLHL